MANNNQGLAIGIWAIVGILLIWGFGTGAFADLFGAAEAPIEEKEIGDITDSRDYPETCNLNPTLTYGPVEARWAPTTSMAGENHRVYFDGVEQGLKVDSSTATPGYMTDITIYYAENSSTYLDTHVNFKMPCKSITSAQFDGKTLHKLITLDINPTINCFNSDTGNLNTVNDNETIGANEKGKFTCTIDGDSYQGWNNGEDGKGEVTMVIILNKTAYDESKTTVTGGWVTGIVPASQEYNYTAQVAKAFKKTIPFSQNGIDESFGLEVTSESGHNPGLTGGDVRIDIYTPAYWRHSISGQMNYGYETDTSTLAAPGTTTTTPLASVIEKMLNVA